MSIFITSVGATDNEICAPISQAILNHLDRKGFKFSGIPSVQPQVLTATGEISFRLASCNLLTQSANYSYDKIREFVEEYREGTSVTPELNEKVKGMLHELEQLITRCNCGNKKSCSHCTLVNRETLL